MKKEIDQIEIENILHHLNYRWNIEVLAQWESVRVSFKPYQIYDGYEFYSLDYLLGWMGESIMERYLSESLGTGWMLRNKTGDILKKWWSHGNRFNIFKFFKINGLGSLTADLLIKRWEENLS